MKVFLFGLDGMTMRILKPYIADGLLPNFAKVLDGGSSGILRSTIPFYTGPGWTSIATGMNPGKHNIFGFWKKNGYKTELVTKNNSVLAEPVWKILSRKGKKVAVMNVPFTYPPDKVNGVMSSGLMTPEVGIDKDIKFTHPEELQDEIFRIVPDYQIGVKFDKLLFYGKKDGVLEEVFKTTKQDRTIMMSLLEKDNWDFFYMCFDGTDRLQHFLWDEIISKDSKCVSYYQYLDEILGDVLKQNDDTALFIVSDHGFRHSDRGFHINNFLKDLDLLNTKGDIQRKVTGTIGQRVAMSGFGRRMWRFVKNLLPMWLKRYLVTNILKQHSSEDEIDWQQTKAFSLLGEGCVSINLKYREPNGVVEEQDYEDLCNSLKQKLLEFRDPENGRKVIKEVHIASEIYQPHNRSLAPDLVAVAYEGYTINQTIVNEVMSENKMGGLHVNGDHEREGVIAVYGDVINKKEIDASIYDVMPTILYLMGQAVPEDVDGRVLTEIIDPAFVAENEVRFEKSQAAIAEKDDSLGDKEREEIEQQLRDLGYMD